LEFVFDLIGSERGDQVSRIMDAAKISKNDHQEIVDNLSSNKNGLSVSKYKTWLKNMFGYSDEEIKAKKATFFPAYINASDYRGME
jgi:hypothetical protein